MPTHFFVRSSGVENCVKISATTSNALSRIGPRVHVGLLESDIDLVFGGECAPSPAPPVRKSIERARRGPAFASQTPLRPSPSATARAFPALRQERLAAHQKFVGRLAETIIRRRIAVLPVLEFGRVGHDVALRGFNSILVIRLSYARRATSRWHDLRKDEGRTIKPQAEDNMRDKAAHASEVRPRRS